MLFRQLLPHSGEIEIETYVRGFELPGRAPEDRPYTVANFISSLDGRASVTGRSGGLGDDGDKALFRALRGAVDAVLVGTGTLRAERYGRLIKDPETRARRQAEGLRAEPVACILTRSGQLPFDIPLFSEPEAEVVVFTGTKLQAVGAAAHVTVVRLDPAELDFAHALGRLRAEHGVRSLLCEGGPAVFSALLHERVVDELCLTLAPRLVAGGTETAITAGTPLPELAGACLAGVLERNSSLFLRYQRTN